MDWESGQNAVFSIDEGRVVSEAFDDEVIVVDFGTGSYFSLRGAAVPLWTRLTRGLDSDHLEAWARSTFDTPDEALPELRSLVDTLVSENLVDLVTGGAPPVFEIDQGTVIAFDPPLFERHDDMTEMIAIDPIHEVKDQAGWPNPAE